MASSNKEWPKVMSNHNRNRSCGPCILCKKMQPRYDHYCILKESAQGFLQLHFGSEIPSRSGLCHSHVVEAKCIGLTQSVYLHRKKVVHSWKENEMNMCMYPGCTITDSSLGEWIITPTKDNLPIFR